MANQLESSAERKRTINAVLGRTSRHVRRKMRLVILVASVSISALFIAICAYFFGYFALGVNLWTLLGSIGALGVLVSYWAFSLGVSIEDKLRSQAEDA